MVSIPLALVMFITAAYKWLRNSEGTIQEIKGSTGKYPCLIFSLFTSNINWTVDHHKHQLKCSGIEPGFGCNRLDTAVCHSNTNKCSDVSTDTVLHFHCKNSGYVIERINGLVAEKPLKSVQSVTAVHKLDIVHAAWKLWFNNRHFRIACKF
jgi:hypothetical protein